MLNVQTSKTKNVSKTQNVWTHHFHHFTTVCSNKKILWSHFHRLWRFAAHQTNKLWGAGPRGQIGQGGGVSYKRGVQGFFFFIVFLTKFLFFTFFIFCDVFDLDHIFFFQNFHSLKLKFFKTFFSGFCHTSSWWLCWRLRYVFFFLKL